MRCAKTAILLSVYFVGLTFSASSASASDWMFRRSYHSHEGGAVPPSGEVPWSRSAYRQPYVNYPPRAAVRGGWRFNNYTLHNGNSVDNMNYREFYFGAQY